MTPESLAVLRMLNLCGGSLQTAVACWSQEHHEQIAFRRQVVRLHRRGYLRTAGRGQHQPTAAGLVALNRDERGIGQEPIDGFDDTDDQNPGDPSHAEA